MERESIVARDFLGPRNGHAELKSGRDLGVVKEGESNCLPDGLHLGAGSMAKECMFGTQVHTESEIQQREDLKRYIKERVCLANMALQQPYSNKTSALQQFMTFKNLQEERSQKGLFGQLATSGVQPITTADAFDLNNKSMAGSQKCFSLDPTARSTTESGDYNAWQNSSAGRHFGVSRVVYPSQALDDQGSSAHHIQEIGIFTSPNHSLPISNVCSPPLFKGQQASSTSAVVPMVKPFMGMHFAGQRSFSPVVGASAGTTVPRATPNVPGKPGTAQLTIFYAGTVNVYEDVPADKAEAIMFLAGSGSSWSGKINNPPTQSPAISIPVAIGSHSRPVTPVCPNPSNSSPSMNPQAHPQKSQAIIQANQSTTVSSSAGEFQTGQNGGNPSNQQEGPKSTTTGSTPTPVVPRVPQARKASLARFLEKRKERVCSKAPYSTKKSLEDFSYGEKSLSPKRCYTPPPVDGCELQHCEPVGDGLNGKFVPKREDSTSCLERDHNKQSWSLKFEKNDITECKLQLT